ncbi:MAG TPA: hypothetical protein P5277_03665 [Candidatus Paceibacterota bacterium]|nr:hypothetical protein [Candidatus Paceibacterota bacterium]
MENLELINKIMEKKEFSRLRKIDVLKAFSFVENRNFADEKKIKLTRDLLRQVFSAFINTRIFSFKERSYEDVLKKHKSTNERFNSYGEVYLRILKNFNKIDKLSIIDLGAGVNGFSFKFFESLNYKVNYSAVESVGQFVDLMNNYFKKEKLEAQAFHYSLFEINEILSIIKKIKSPRVILLMKTIDSLEMLERDYSKKLISEILNICDSKDIFVVSFATESLIKKIKFKAKRYWIYNFIKENYNLIDDFEISGERYLIFTKQ